MRLLILLLLSAVNGQDTYIKNNHHRSIDAHTSDYNSNERSNGYQHRYQQLNAESQVQRFNSQGRNNINERVYSDVDNPVRAYVVPKKTNNNIVAYIYLQTNSREDRNNGGQAREVSETDSEQQSSNIQIEKDNASNDKSNVNDRFKQKDKTSDSSNGEQSAGTVDSGVDGYRWIWGGDISTPKVDFKHRAAFNGDACPNHTVRVGNACVAED